MFCFAFQYNLQYELPPPPPFFCNIAKFEKNRLCSEGYISEGNTLICFISVVKQYSETK